MLDLGKTRCSSCGAAISFIRSATSNKSIPVNAGKQRTIVTASGEVRVGWEPHWATCPNADQHRKAR